MIYLYQIYYDDKTKEKVSNRCIGLDNSNPPIPGWFEFFPILDKLTSLNLVKEYYYGFLSPKFESKTGVHPDQLYDIVNAQRHKYEVFISNYSWDQTGFFKNAWEQGDFWHPGLKDMTQKFINHVGLDVSLDQLIGCKFNTVASNYIVANGDFWTKWQGLALAFIQYMRRTEGGECLFSKSVPYAHKNNNQRLGVFIQERFASLLLTLNNYKTSVFDEHIPPLIFEPIFLNTAANIQVLKVCDLLKQYYLESQDPRFIEAWDSLRTGVLLNPAIKA